MNAMPSSSDSHIINDSLEARFGTATPRWTLTHDSDALQFLDAQGAVVLAHALTPAQAGSVRALGGGTRPLELQLDFGLGAFDLLLVGKRADAGVWTGFAADFTSARSVADVLKNGLSFSEQILSEVHSLVVVIDQNGKLKRFNKLCEEVTGMREDDILGRNAHDLFMPEVEHEQARRNIAHFFQTGESWSVERSIRTKTGVRQVLWRNKFVKGGPEEGTYLVCSGLDITEEVANKQKLVELATTDTLTGLANRHAVQEHLGRLLARAEPNFSVLYFDLDNFKQVNDHYGHGKGDALIKAAAGVIKESLREGDFLARLGGDEMLAVLDGADEQRAMAVAQRILTRFKDPMKLDAVELYTNCSIGIVPAPKHGTTVEELVRNADTAMYAAKDKGRGMAQVFSQEMTEKAQKLVWLDSNLRKALGSSQLELHYQPKVCLRTGRAHGVEALVRWRHPERGFVPPIAFIPYAEESGLIHQIGAWVVEEAARQAAQWKAEGFDVRVAVNISARQLVDDRILQTFKNTLDPTHPCNSLVDVELTESCLAHDEQLALNLIDEFKKLGATIHLDDFGTGYSSLSQLVRVPIDVLKLDRSFISKLCDDSRSRALVRAMVAVSQELDAKVVAEGVETQAQADALVNLGVDFAQGYLFAKPMAAEAATQWLKDNLQRASLRRVA